MKVLDLLHKKVLSKKKNTKQLKNIDTLSFEIRHAQNLEKYSIVKQIW